MAARSERSWVFAFRTCADCGALLWPRPSTTQDASGAFNFDVAATVNPLTGGPVTSWYKEGETYDTVFGSLASAMVRQRLCVNPLPRSPRTPLLIGDVLWCPCARRLFVLEALPESVEGPSTYVRGPLCLSDKLASPRHCTMRLEVRCCVRALGEELLFVCALPPS